MALLSERLQESRKSRSSGSLADRLNKKSTTSTGLEIGPRGGIDVENIDNLIALAKARGLEVKDPRVKEPGLFTKAVDLLSRGTYASAGAAKALVKGENVIEEAWKGLKGEEKETYSDVLKSAGVKNKYVRGGAGFVLDVLLDPTTYVGGSLVKGAGKVAKGGLGVAERAGMKLAPETTSKLLAAGDLLKDAFRTAFDVQYGRTPGLVDDVITAKNKLGFAADDILRRAESLGKVFKKEGIKEADVQVADSILRENRKIELGLREQGFLRDEIDELANSANSPFKKPTEPKALKVYEELVKKSDELNELAVSNKFIKPEDSFRFYSADMLSKEALDRMGKKVKEVGGNLTMSPQDYLKEYKGIISNEDIMKNPIERMGRTEYNLTRDALARSSTSDFVQKYGKDFADPATAAKEGYVPIYRKGKGAVSDIAMADDVLDVMDNISPKGAAKPIGYLKAKDAQFLNGQLYPEFSVLDKLAKASGFDGMTNLFKTMVTGYFPAFHIRNIISGHIQNYQVLGAKALNPANHIDATKVLKGNADTILKLGENEITAKELHNVLNNRFGKTSRYVADLGGQIDEIAGGGWKPNKSMATKINNGSRAVGDFVETNQKAIAFTAQLKDDLTKLGRKATPDELKDLYRKALKSAEEAGFDYSKVTDFEAKVMRRIIPFYSFTRKNIELQLKTLANNPERILNQVKFANALSDIFGGKMTEEDLKGLPPWAKNGLGFKLEDGKFLTEFGTPLEDFVERLNEPFKTTTSSFNPILKYPTEAKLGFDFFRGKDIKDINTVSEPMARFIKSMPDPIKKEFELTNYEDSKGKIHYRANPDLLHKLRNLPTSRIQNTLETMFADKKDKTWIDKLLAFTSGVKIYDIDLEQQAYFDERDAKRELQDRLYKAGQVGLYESAYVPKNIKEEILSNQ